MGIFVILLILSLTYLQGATLYVNQPTRRLISRPHRLQSFRGQQVQNIDHVFGLESRGLQWPRSARRHRYMTTTGQRPRLTRTWTPEQHGQLTQKSYEHVPQSNGIQIESIPKWTQNPQNRNAPSSKLYKPKVMPNNQFYRRRPAEKKTSKSKQRKTSLSKKNMTREYFEDVAALDLMEEYVTTKLALEQSRSSGAEQKTNVDSLLHSTVTAEPNLPAALPPALDFLSSRQLGVSNRKQTSNTKIKDQFEDFQNYADQQHNQPANSPSLFPISENTDSVDYYSNAFKVLTDAFRLTDTNILNLDNMMIPNMTDTPTTNLHTDKLLQENVSNPVTLIKDILSIASPPEINDISETTSLTGEYNHIVNETKPKVQLEDKPKEDRQTKSETYTYAVDENTDADNHTLEADVLSVAIEDVSTVEPNVVGKPMTYLLANITYTRNVDHPHKTMSPPPAKNHSYVATKMDQPPEERQPHHRSFEVRKLRQEYQNLDLFKNEPSIDRNQRLPDEIRSIKNQPFGIVEKQINTKNSMLHRESSFHSFNHPNSPYSQKQLHNVDQLSYPDSQNDMRYLQQYEVKYQNRDNGQNAFTSQNPQQEELRHVERSVPVNTEWDTNSLYGLAPSETRTPRHEQTPVEYQSFERRTPENYIRQTSGQMSSYQRQPTRTRPTWSEPDITYDIQYLGGYERQTASQHASDYVRRNRPPLSHFEKPAVIRRGQQQDVLSNQMWKLSETIVGSDMAPPTTTEDPRNEALAELRSGDSNKIDTLTSWPQHQSRFTHGRTWASLPDTTQTSGWTGIETGSGGSGGWERRSNKRTNSWQQSTPTQTSSWAHQETTYDTQENYNAQQEMYENNEENQYGIQNEHNGYNEYSYNGNSDYTTQESYNNMAPIIDYTDGEGDGSDEDDR